MIPASPSFASWVHVTVTVASADTVGKVVQYVGATGAYKTGYFYIGTTDGEPTPTYSWVEISFGSNISTITYLASDVGTQANPFVFADHPTGLYITGLKSLNTLFYMKAKSTDASALPIFLPKGLVLIDYKDDINDYTSGTSWFADIYTGLPSYQSRTIFMPKYDGTLDVSSTSTQTYLLANETATISKKFTYSVLPESSVAPTSANQLVNKTYADSVAGQTIQYSTMPTASASTVGQIVQYTGATVSGSYTNGYFYIGVDNGGSYSWEEIQVQASSGGGSTTVVLTETNKNYASTLTALTAEYNKFLNNEPYSVMYYGNIGDNSKTVNAMIPLYFDNVTLFNSRSLVSSYIITNTTTNNAMMCTFITKALAFTGDSISGYGQEKRYNFSIPANSGMLITTNNTVSYTPSSDYNPASKKYVDDLLTSFSNYDSTKTQVLKNVSGTFTWVDE